MKTNDFIYNYLLSLQFIGNCSKPNYQNKTVFEVKSELEGKAKANILNPSLLLGMAYVFFVLANETKVLDYKIAKELESKFKIIKWEKDNKDLNSDYPPIVRRIRNAISHGKIDYFNQDKKFLFKDGKDEIIFSAEITFDNFKDLLFDLAVLWYNQNK